MSDHREAKAATIVGRWKVGFDSKSGYVVLVFEFDDRAPMPFVIPMEAATAMGHALTNLDAIGVPSPAKPN